MYYSTNILVIYDAEKPLGGPAIIKLIVAEQAVL